MRPYLSRTYQQVAMFWALAVGIVLAGYCLCLRFLFPGYFAPLSAFHVDFYDYAASAVHPYSILLTRYSRPASFAVAKSLADAGFPTLLVGEIVIALLSVLVTLAVARRTLGLYSNWVLAPFALYVILLFGHPEFYAVHRHDLAAECAYLFLVVSLLAWVSFVKHRRTLGVTRAVILIIGALFFAVMSAFSKETYFVSALCLLAGLALSSRPNRRLHAAFLVLFVILDCCSYAWNRHVGWPPANVSSDYKMSLALSDLARTYYFYLRHFLNPAFILLPLIGIIAVARDRSRFVLSCAFLLAGLAAFIPHAILPNHLESEYAWLAAPLFLAPLLLVCEPTRPTRFTLLHLVVAGAVAVLAVIGPGGYSRTYRKSPERWFIEEDRKGAAMVESLRRLQAIPRPSRVLVVGLEDTAIPWEAGDFLHHEFGDRILWSVVLPESIEYRRSSRLADFPNAADLKVENFDYIATYNSSDRLLDIRPVSAIPASETRSEVIVPALKPLLKADATPHDPRFLLASTKMAVKWGLWGDAEKLLGEAKLAGASEVATAALSTQIRAAVVKAAASPHEVTLVARPDHVIQPDGSGLAEVELFWTLPDGAASEVHVNAPDGALFASSSGSGYARTGKWVNNGMQFFLQDVSGGKPLTEEHTLARITVDVSR